MGSEDRIVWLNNRSSNLGRGIHGELQFGFLGVVDGQTFEKQSTESRSSTSTERVENENTLETIA